MKRHPSSLEYGPIDSPERIPAVFVEAWNNRDPDTLASIFDEDGEFVNVTGLWWHDRASIRKAHAYGLENIFNRSTLQLVRVKVKRLSDDVAVVHARMRLSGQTPVGGVTSPGTRHTIFSFVVHRTAEGWRCASAQNTDVVPGMETNIIDDAGRLRSVDYSKGGTA
ncbi:MAG TPA: SgcJ/EcaC family oxidoreductase [Rhodothermales bacterium]|nr:SgcJ/EcaC family oxidoreductase [Rhodothermales bacterium]